MKVRRLRARLWLGVAALLGTLSTAITGVGTAHADTGYFDIGVIVDDLSRCLDVRKQDDYNHANARVQIWDCSGALEQKWSSRLFGLGPPGGEFGSQPKLYQFVNLRSGMCLEVRDGLLSSGQQVDQFPCASPGGSVDTNARQLWLVVPVGFVEGILRYTLSPWSALRAGVGMCLDVRGGDSDNGTLLQQYPCNRTEAQMFYGGAMVPS